MSKPVKQVISEFVERGALFVVNDSGGKDSQAMKALIRNTVPASQILVIHAELPGVEWDGTEAHARATSQGLDFIVVRAVKTFFEMVRHRGLWPSPKYRQCTSDLKRGPIEKAIRHAVKNRENKLIINCMGLRAEESRNRAKAEILKLNKRNSKAGREWWDFLPIHDYLLGDVWFEIKKAGQQPHWAYEKGMSRLSCVFCIMSSKKDLVTIMQTDKTKGFLWWYGFLFFVFIVIVVGLSFVVVLGLKLNQGMMNV